MSLIASCVALFVSQAAVQSPAPVAALDRPSSTAAPARLPAFVWRKNGAELSELVTAFGGACAMRLDDTRELHAAGVETFVFNAPGRDDLHLERDSPTHRERWRRWYETRDDAWLVREPCWRAPETLARLERLLDESLTRHAANFGHGVSLGDEIGLTPGGAPEDVCLCPACREAWKTWWTAHRSGEAPPLESISTDAARRALFDGDTTPLGNWLARRRFHQDGLLDVLKGLSARVRARASNAPVGLLGISGQSAFGGVAVERVMPMLDFVECYAVGNARELAYTLRRDSQRVWLTIFAEEAGPAHSARTMWDHWMRGGNGFVMWSEATLERQPAQTARLLDTLRTLRELDGALGSFRARPRGIAIVHSHADVAAQWMRDALLDGATWPRRFQSWQERHGTLERSRRQWFEMAEEHGAMPGALPEESIGAHTVERFALLVLVDALVVDAPEIEALRAYRAAGGRVCLAGEFAWIDSTGRRHDEATRRRWLEELRPTPPPPAGAMLNEGPLRRAATADWWRTEGVESAPWQQTGESAQRWAWTSTWFEVDGDVIGALLPRVSSGAWPERVELAVKDGEHVEWLHPRAESGAAVTLAPGDAAVFRLRRERR